MPKVSELTATPALGDGDLIYVVADGASSKLASLRVSSIAAMTAIAVPLNGMSVEVTEDGRGGLFVFDTSVTAAGDGGTTFSADDATTGSWVRRYSGAVDVGWFPATTAGVQAALDLAGVIFFPGGTFTVAPLNVSSNTTIIFSPDTLLLASAGYGDSDRLLNIDGVSDVVIYGNGGTIQMIKAEYVSGEQRHCVNIGGSDRVSIYDLTAKDSGGDGFYIGGASVSSNVALVNCVADNNRRQGCSITNGKNVLILGGEYKNTIGTAPEFGIDVESNAADGYYLRNISIIGVQTTGNNGGGILLSPMSKFDPVSITVSNCASHYDGDGGGVALNASGAAQSGAQIGRIRGHITVRDCAVINPQGSGIVSINWTERAPKARVENCYVLNPYSNGALLDNAVNKSGLLIRGELPSSGSFGTETGNIEVFNLTVEDDRVTPLMSIPVYLNPADEATKPLKNIRLHNVVASADEWTWATDLPVLRSGSLAVSNVRISYDKELIVTSGSKTFGVADIGAIYTATTSSSYTLPAAADHLGAVFSARVTDASGPIQIVTTGTDAIANYTLAGSAQRIMAREVGAQITVKATASGVWQVVNISGGWATSNYFGARLPPTWNSAAPVAGAWAVGDIVYNTAPAAAGKIGWVCVTAGTPGTWKPFGAIDA